jgi:hypothetical protein
MKSLLISAAFIIALTRLCRDLDEESNFQQLTKPLPLFPEDAVGNLNHDPGRPYDLFNFYYPPGQTSIRFH